MDEDRKHHTKSERTSTIWYHLYVKSKKWGSDRLTDTENKSTVTKGKRDQRKDKLGYPSRKNPVDRGAWWAAVHGVSQSWTRLKRFNMHACIGEGNGNSLQCSCPENSMDRGACQATVYRVSQSQTWLRDWIHTQTINQKRKQEGNQLLEHSKCSSVCITHAV